MKRPTEEDLAERQAQASPRDFPQDMDKPDHGWQVCGWCLHLFLGLTSRTRCRDCCAQHGNPA